MSLMGGLGNRMFQISAAYIVHATNSLPLYVIIQRNEHSNKHYMDTLFRHFPVTHGYPVAAHAVTVRQSDECFGAWNPAMDKRVYRLDGYFQYYPVMRPFEKDIRDLFIRGLETERRRLQRALLPLGFIHIRRGDYLKKSHIHYVQPIEYYERAVQMIISGDPDCRFYVLSDDMAWVRAQSFFRNDRFVLFEEGDELTSMALMSLCTRAAICANSTFSWWGAFLGAYAQRNPIVIPEHFIAAPMYENIFPEEWRRI